ncbi:MAG: acVLRF1 family peptidyl-tRNA hydrolase [Ornithinimicrobium sp.]
MTEPRRIDVPRDRLAQWVDGFAQRHGEPTWTIDGSAYRATAPNGAWATFSSWTAAPSLPPDLLVWSEPPGTFAIILIRRGGYAVGVVSGGELVAHKCGTRYVQSRTAAGGWSQQRYARRRSNQRDELVDTVIERVVTLKEGHRGEGVVLGGDQPLASAVLDDRRLESLAIVPRREFYDIPDPRFVVLQKTLSRALMVSVTVSNPESS